MTLKRPPGLTFRPLKRVSHSTLEALRACWLRVAFELDPAFAAVRRPTTWSALGTSVHRIYEALAAGDFDSVPEEELEAAVDAKWQELIETASDELKAQAGGMAPPPPERWPRYQQTRVSLLVSVVDAVQRKRHLAGTVPKPSAPFTSVEKWVETPDGLLVGRIDRVESRDGYLELVDIKNGVSWPEPSLGPDSSYGRQLLLYAFIWQKVHGEWPDRLSVQRTDGSRISVATDHQQALAQGTEAYALLEAFNQRVSESPSEEGLASPSPETCSYCPFRGACKPFFAETSPEWEMYRATVKGKVLDSEQTRLGRRLTVDVQQGTVEAANTWRVSPVIDSADLEVGDTISVSDAFHSRASTDLRLDWDSVLWHW